jgi:hypothetical protein
MNEATADDVRRALAECRAAIIRDAERMRTLEATCASVRITLRNIAKATRMLPGSGDLPAMIREAADRLAPAPKAAQPDLFADAPKTEEPR